MRNSTRSAVDPFIVMDVMEAARAAEDAGRHIIHMEVGQPGTGAPQRGRRGAGASAMDEGALWAIPWRWGCPRCARVSRRCMANGTTSIWTRRGWWSRPGSSGGFLLAFTALFDSGDRVAIGAPGYPSYRQILRALGICRRSICPQRPRTATSRCRRISRGIWTLRG